MTTPVAPVVNSILFDQEMYSAGEKINVTITYTPGASSTTQTLTGVATDSLTNEVGDLTVNFTVLSSDSTVVSVSDSGGRDWVPVSNNGNVAVFTAVA